jgi:hypothetical protein
MAMGMQRGKCMENSEKERIEEFVDTLRLDKTVSPEEFYRSVKNAYQNRTRQVYFIWKAIKELYPDVDANKIVRHGSRNFGIYQGKKIAGEAGTSELGPIDALLKQTSRGGYMVFDQEITRLSDKEAEKLFGACPHAEALKELGLNDEEIRMFCRDMLIACDYGIVEPFKDVVIDFPTTVADGEGEPCRMTIRRRGK